MAVLRHHHSDNYLGFYSEAMTEPEHELTEAQTMKATLDKIIPHAVAIELGGSEIADLFWNLCEREQAEFFNQLATFKPLPFQLQSVTDSDELTDAGRCAMGRIGEYAERS